MRDNDNIEAKTAFTMESPNKLLELFIISNALKLKLHCIVIPNDTLNSKLSTCII
jgi:hypothetical protein